MSFNDICYWRSLFDIALRLVVKSALIILGHVPTDVAFSSKPAPKFEHGFFISGSTSKPKRHPQNIEFWIK